jgi:regulator of protease activity HflC (stomatin/prohibitin superfamily)
MSKLIDDTDKLVWGVIKKILIPFGIFIILIIGVFNTFYTVQAGDRAVVLTWGSPNMVPIGSGLHLKIPFAQDVVKMTVQTQKYEAELSAASKDLQDVNTKIAINYHIVPEKMPEIYRDIGINYAEKVIYPYEQETNKGITSQFTAVELITEREQVRERMKTDLAAKLKPRGIIVEEVSIINFAFSPSF